MEKERRTAIAILEEFDELLSIKGITVPSADREGDKEEASLYGQEYYDLEDRIVEILKKANK